MKTVEALVSVNGRYAGRAPTFEADRVWWSEIEAVTAHLDALLGVRTVVVRLLHADETETGRGGRVAYHVEALDEPAPGVLDPAPVADWASVVAPHPLRAGWAEPDGTVKLIRWAQDRLGPADWRQVKTWNLSCLLRFTTSDGGAWAKATSRFGSVDGDVIRHVRSYDARLAPEVLDVDLEHRWSLLRHAPGADCWEPDLATVEDVVSRWVAVQAALGDPPAVPRMLPEDIAGELARMLAGEMGSQLSPDEVVQAQELVDALPGLVAVLESSRLPHTLVHGDFHPGNWRSDGSSRLIVDWADSYYGHPAADINRLCDYLPEDKWAVALDTWATAWRRQLPGCEPELALAPIAVLARLLGAITYQRFLDNIEPSERVYHEEDPANEVRAAIQVSGLRPEAESDGGVVEGLR